MTNIDLYSNENEIEYFGFLPIAFTLELQNELEKVIDETFDENQDFLYLKTTMINIFNKHFFLFNNFILRNILKFPDGFVWERKKTDKVVKVNLNKKIKQFKKLQEELAKKQAFLVKKELELLKEVNKNEGYKCIFANVKDILLGFTLLEDTSRQYEALKKNFNMLIYDNKKEYIQKALDHKYMKQEYYQNEKKRLFKIAKLNILEYLVKIISK